MSPEEQNPSQPNEQPNPPAVPEVVAPNISNADPIPQTATEFPSTPESTPLSEVSVQPASFAVNEPQVFPASAPVVGAPEEPVVPSFAAQPPVTPGMPSDPVPNAKNKKRWLVPAIIIATLVILIGGGYVLGIYLPNKPSNVYSKSLSNSGKALDKLVEYAHTQQQASYKGYSFDGSLKAKSPDVSFDASLSGAFDDKAGNYNMTANVLGQKITANVRSIVAKGNTTPDLYVQVFGVKQYLDSFGLTSLDSLDGQWIAVDHTIFDTYLAQVGTGASKSTAMATPTPDQVNDALSRLQTVNKQYLFTTGGDKAVLQNEKYIGKETKNGRSLYHYTVGYDKAHLQAYVGALKTAADGSKLNSWSKSVYDGKNLSQVFDLKPLQDSVKNADSNYRFDVWADSKTKLLQSVKFGDPKDKTNSLTIGQNYTGGDSYPFTFSVTSAGTKAAFNVVLNTKTNKVTGTISGSVDTTTTLTGSFSAQPSNKSVQVTEPAGAKPIMSILNQLGLGGALGATDTSALSAQNDLLTFEQ